MSADHDKFYKLEAAKADSIGVCAIDDETAVVTQAYFDSLPEYSLTDPTGVFVGKRWKARGTVVPEGQARPVLTDQWFMRSYEEHPTDPEKVRRCQRVLLVVS